MATMDQLGHGSSRVDADMRTAGEVQRSSVSLLHGSVTEGVLSAFFDVYNELRSGFLESVYGAALGQVLTAANLHVAREVAIEVHFRGVSVGRYFADLVVEHLVIVEVKAVRAIRPEHEAQLLHYLRATPIEVGLLLNFGSRPEFKRIVYSNSLKRSFRSDSPR